MGRHPDELVEGTITFTLWTSRQAMIAVGRDLGLAGIRLLERLIEWVRKGKNHVR